MVGVLLLIGIVYLIFSKCTSKTTTKDRIAPLRTFFETLDESGEGAVDKEEFWEAIENEKEMRPVFAGAKELCKRDYRGQSTEKKGKISWPEFVAWVDKRLASEKSTRKDD